MEKNYDFIKRHWDVHKQGRRNSQRIKAEGEVEINRNWHIVCGLNSPVVLKNAVADFADFFNKSMGMNLDVCHKTADNSISFECDDKLEDADFVIDAADGNVRVILAKPGFAFKAVVHMEDMMCLEGAPVLPLGKTVRKSIYRRREVHSGCGIDAYPDEELRAIVHAGYDTIALFIKAFDRSASGVYDFADVIDRAENFGIEAIFFNYMPSYIHPDDPGAAALMDSVYGELFRRFPKAAGVSLGGESLEFPSKDPATTGKHYYEGGQDGIAETKPSPGWYPCSDYPAYLRLIEQAVHAVKPDAEVIFSTYNWGYAPVELRKKFLENFPEKMTLSVCYEVFSRKKLEGLNTPVMDYTISVLEPGYYFTSECGNASKLGIPIHGNVNTAGIGWDYGCVPYVPVPGRWLFRDKRLREACENWGVRSHYCTHHYGYWNCVAADLGKWSSWENFEPDYAVLLQKIAIRDYGMKDAEHALAAWRIWDNAMDYYIASNEDQYGPWRVGPAYPFIFHPDITRTLQSKEIRFPTNPGAHFGYKIIKTLYHPFENENQAPGFLRHPAELRSLGKMLELWNKGLEEAAKITDTQNGKRLEALGHFIRNSIITTIHIKEFYRLNMKMMASDNKRDALYCLDEIEKIVKDEAENVIDTIPAVETDSRIGWEPSMEYVCDKWHLEWKLRQLHNALDEMKVYRGIMD